MKKIFLTITMVLAAAFYASAQLMQLDGYNNTLWTGFGNAWNSADTNGEKSKARLDSKNWGALGEDDDLRWNGVLDTFQARLTSKTLFVDLMLQWGGLSTYDASGDLDYLKFQYIDSDVNFVANITNNFDIAMGTYLNWKMGPAPAHGANSWETGYHLLQGGMGYGTPSQNLVAGAAYYANYINESLELAKATTAGEEVKPVTEALAARFRVEDVLEIAAAVPSGTTSDDFLANVGVRFTPADQFLFAFAYNGIFRKDSNLYAGLTIGTDTASIDGWLAIDNIGGKKDNRITGVGGAVTFSTNGITLRPEVGFTFYENSNYSTACYGGVDLKFALSKNLDLGAWGSLAFGSKESGGATGGKIFDVRPNITYYISSSDALSASYEYQFITTNQDNDYNFWQAGFFWSHAF